MKKRWIALTIGAVAVAAGAGLYQGHRLPPLSPPLTIHSGGRVERLTLSPDGRLLADDTPSGQVLLYDTATGQQSHALAVRTDRMVFSPDGRRLLTENMRASSTNPNGSVQVWDTATGAQLSRIVFPAGPGGAPDIATVSRDLRRAVVRVGAGYTVYGVAAGNVIKSLPLPSGRTQAVFSPDGSLLAVSSGAAEALQVWDTKTWRPVQATGGQISGVTGIRFSPDGSRLALGSKAGLAWWGTHTWKPEGRFAFPTPYGLSRGYFYFSPDSRSLLVSEVEPASGMHQADCGTGRETLRVPSQKLQHVSMVGNRAETKASPTNWNFFSPDKRDTYCIWDTARKKPLYQIAVPLTANSPITGDFQSRSIDLSADGHVFAVGGFDDGIIRVWRLP